MDHVLKREGLSEKEYQKIVKILGRKPNEVELGMCGVMWSEHCSYKSSKGVLKELPVGGERVLKGPGGNAGVIDIGGGLAVVMKVESHNYPSRVEPYEGAATGVGGIIRDILAMGGRPVALLNSLRFGGLEEEGVRRIFDGVVRGIGGYGNCIGVPTVGGEVYFEGESYAENPIVNVMCVGLVEVGKVLGNEARGVGNSVIYVGGGTGRDGVGGANLSSRDLEFGVMGGVKEEKGSIQLGDPWIGKLLMEGCLEILEKGYIVGMQDMGAGGLTSVICEMAGRGRVGLRIDLEEVPKRDEKIGAYELMLSESQERFLLIVKKEDEDSVIEIFKKWGLKAKGIGEVVEGGSVQIWEGDRRLVDLPVRELFFEGLDELGGLGGLDRGEGFRGVGGDFNWGLGGGMGGGMKMKGLGVMGDEGKDWNGVLLKMIGSENLASRRWIYEQYDTMVGTNTVIGVGSGDANVIRLKGSVRGLAVSIDGNSRYMHLDPRRGAEIAVAEGCRNVVSVGGEPVGVTDGLNYGDPKDDRVFWEFQEGVMGIKGGCEEMGIPVVSGNVSFYNGKIYPTVMIGTLGLVRNIQKVRGMGYRRGGDRIIVMGEGFEELGGSEYWKVMEGMVGGECPDLDWGLEKKVQRACFDLLELGLLESVHDVSEGGLCVNIVESCLVGGYGAYVELEERAGLTVGGLLFGESQSRIVVSVSVENLEGVRGYFERNGVWHEEIGEVVEGEGLKVNDWIGVGMEELRGCWERFKDIGI